MNLTRGQYILSIVLALLVGYFAGASVTVHVWQPAEIVRLQQRAQNTEQRIAEQWRVLAPIQETMTSEPMQMLLDSMGLRCSPPVQKVLPKRKGVRQTPEG